MLTIKTKKEYTLKLRQKYFVPFAALHLMKHQRMEGTVINSGEYLTLGARGKDFQKLIFKKGKKL